MECWRCGVQQADSGPKVAFRATCDRCGAWFHVCKNCRHYKPGRRNDCEIPETELIADREACNFCEHFSVLGVRSSPSAKPADVLKRLFGENA